MSATIPTTEPTSLMIGDTWEWRRENLSDYPASEWTLTYYFRNTTEHFDVVADADGDVYSITVASATSAALVSGDYDWFATVSKTGYRYNVGSGRITLTANIAQAADYDARSFARKMMAYIEAALLDRATKDQLDLISATLEGRGVSMDKGGLIQLRREFMAELRTEENRLRVKQCRAGRNRIVILG